MKMMAMVPRVNTPQYPNAFESEEEPGMSVGLTGSLKPGGSRRAALVVLAILALLVILITLL